MRWMDSEGTNLGRVYALGTQLTYVCSLFILKMCRTDALSLAFYRGMGCCMIVYAISKYKGFSLFVSWDHVGLSSMRSLFGASSIMCAFIANKLVNISVITVVTRLQTIVLTLMGVVLLNNPFDVKILLAGFMSILGVVLVVSPSVLGLAGDSDRGLELQWTIGEILGVLLSVGFVITNSFSYIVLSSAAGRVSIYHLVFYLNMGVCLISSVMMVVRGAHVEYVVEETVYYILMIIGLFVSQMMFSESARLEKNVGVQAVLQSSSVIYSIFIDVAIMGNSVSVVNVVGVIIVICTSVYAVNISHR